MSATRHLTIKFMITQHMQGFVCHAPPRANEVTSSTMAGLGQTRCLNRKGERLRYCLIFCGYVVCTLMNTIEVTIDDTTRGNVDKQYILQETL